MKLGPKNSDQAVCDNRPSPRVGSHRGPKPGVVGWSDVSGPPHLLPEALFREDLRREQLRAIRSGAYLTLAVISVDSVSETAEHDLYRLAQALQLVVRETDVLGWYGKSAIAILMTDTDSEGGVHQSSYFSNNNALFSL